MASFVILRSLEVLKNISFPLIRLRILGVLRELTIDLGRGRHTSIGGGSILYACLVVSNILLDVFDLLDQVKFIFLGQVIKVQLIDKLLFNFVHRVLDLQLLTLFAHR